MPLTVENIYQWMDENRPYNLSEDLEQLWDDDSLLNTFLISRAYIGYVIRQNRHEDYERDRCNPLIENDGPYADILADVVREIDGEDIEDYPICVDSLISYVSTPVYESHGDDWINTGVPQYITEIVLKEFFFYYLDCFTRDDDKVNELPDSLNADYKSIIKPKLYEALIKLSQ